ncbi:hypothetical protein LSCM4_01558 [Leishmania orientalis]|uniref:Kinetoplastid PH-like domain-containing protein n=1 Tax=Leishmania orientalis TaxID=2249476 RepID=A0A836FP54_9TRYP|nr:hypothetical protein LSCM4_01558 [Leishmania orientalis]
MSTASLPNSASLADDGGRGHLAQAETSTAASALTTPLPPKSPVSRTAAVKEAAHLTGAPAAAPRRLTAPFFSRALLGSGAGLYAKTASVSTPLPDATTSLSVGAADRQARFSLQAFAPMPHVPCERMKGPSTGTAASLSSITLPREHVEPSGNTSAALRLAFSSSPSVFDSARMPAAVVHSCATQPLRRRPALLHSRMSQSPLQDPPRSRLPSLTRSRAALPSALPSSETAAGAQVSVASWIPSPLFSAYEPIRVLSTSVPRAHDSCCSSVCRRRTSPSSALGLDPSRWYRCSASSLMPRMMYHTELPRWRRNSDAKGSPSRAQGCRYSKAAHRSGLLRGNRKFRWSPSASLRRGSHWPAHPHCHVGDADASAIPPPLSVIATPHYFLEYPVRVSSFRCSGKSDTAADGVAAYVFITLDENYVVAVPAARFTQLIEAAKFLPQQKAAGGTAKAQRDGSGASSLSVGVRSFKRAQRFFGEEHCRGMRVAAVERVSKGDREPPLVLDATQRKRLDDLSRVVCISTWTDALIIEAANSSEAEWYVGHWKAYLRSRREAHRKALRGTALEKSCLIFSGLRASAPAPALAL